MPKQIGPLAPHTSAKDEMVEYPVVVMRVAHGDKVHIRKAGYAGDVEPLCGAAIKWKAEIVDTAHRDQVYTVCSKCRKLYAAGER